VIRDYGKSRIELIAMGDCGQAELADMAGAPEYLRLDIGWLKMRRAGSRPRRARLIAIEFLPMTA
jgi:hypothetical protein